MKTIGVIGLFLAVLIALISYLMGTHYETQIQNQSNKHKQQQEELRTFNRKLQAEAGPNGLARRVGSDPVSAKRTSSSEAIWIGCNRAKFKILIGGIAFACLMFFIDTKTGSTKSKKTVKKREATMVKIDIPEDF